MKRILENMDRKKIALITAALAVLLLSVFVISKAAADPANHTQTLESLDEKKEDVLAMQRHPRRRRRQSRRYPETRRRRWQISWRI